MPKLCEVCHKRPATVPDRNRTGRLINRVCSSCHRDRLAGDLRRGMTARRQQLEKRERAEHEIDEDE